MALYDRFEALVQGFTFSCMCKPRTVEAGIGVSEYGLSDGNSAVDEIDPWALKTECEIALKGAKRIDDRRQLECLDYSPASSGESSMSEVRAPRMASDTTFADSADSIDFSGSSVASQSPATRMFSEDSLVFGITDDFKLGLRVAKDGPPYTSLGEGKARADAAAAAEGGETQPSAASAAEDWKTCTEKPPARPDFTGTWLLIRVEGPMEAFLKECAVGYLTRTAAKAIRYGVNSTRQVVKQTPSGDEISVHTQLTLGSYSYTMRFDDTEQQNTDPFDGRMMLLRPFWSEDGQVAVCEGKCEKTGSPLPTTRRSLQGDHMYIQQTSRNGLVVKRVFKRIDAA